MSSLASKIRIYLDRKVDFTKDVLLQDDRIGGVSNTYIKEWNVDEVQPTQEQLDALESQANDAETIKQVDTTRRNAYGSWNDQLDEIYHDIDAWKSRIQQIKTDNPK
tara:strand:+ start:546 stop:866 length:321 start_codon:yes stop_codon:yes gene_type:complete